MKLETDCQKFDGKVKYTGRSLGSIPWKSGALKLTKEHGNWKLDMLYDCQPNRSVLTVDLIGRKVLNIICKETGLTLNYTKNKGEVLTISFRPAQKHQVRHLQAIMSEVQQAKNTAAVPEVKCEVGLSKSSTTPRKSPLWTSTNVASKHEDSSPQRFTSVKENKPFEWDLDDGDEKENLGSMNNKFLERSAEKSRSTLSFYGSSSANAKPLFNSTPNNSWLNSKRQPGLMPDPTPTKRARLLSDSIPYSMKAKPPQQQSNLKQAPVLQGFSNLGNTCYMNSILQSLFCLDTFSTDLAINRKLLKALSPQSLYSALVKLLHVKAQQSSADETRRMCLKRVKSAISNTAKRFLGYGQHDAHEFLGQVLDQLKEEVIKVSKATPSPSPNRDPAPEATSPDGHTLSANPITQNFEFEVVHSLTCTNCGECVMKAEQFHDISLDLPKHKDQFTARSLQDALSLFFKNEEIEYACEKCDNKRSLVSHKLTRLPRIFILHLKRYLYSQTMSRNTKMGQNVTIPLYVTLKNHCTELTQPPFPPTLNNPSLSDQKSAIELDDSKEEAPSRRKLEYTSGFKFSRKGLSASFAEDGDTSSEKTEKKDEVDGAQRPRTLEDEEDPDMARAIEMSLMEHTEKDKMARDFGEDTEENFERVMEMSRRECDSDLGDLKKKKYKDLSDDEMLQLAIEQSLASHHGNFTESDDVIVPGNQFTQIDDVTGNGHHNYTRSSDASHSTSVSKNSFQSLDIEPDKPTPAKTNHPFTKTYSSKMSKINKRADSDFDLICLEKTADIDSDTAESGKENSEAGNDVTGNDVTGNDETGNDLIGNGAVSEDEHMLIEDITEKCDKSVSKSEKSFTQRLSGLASTFSSGDEESIASETETEMDTAASKLKFGGPSETFKPKTMYEVFKKQNGLYVQCDSDTNCDNDTDLADENKSTSVNSKKDDPIYTITDTNSDNQKLDHYENSTDIDSDNQVDNKNRSNSDCEIVDTNVHAQTPVERKCQLRIKGDDSTSTRETDKGKQLKGKGDDFVFDSDEDDVLLHAEDKENKLPTMTEKPRLSSPREFNSDLTTSDGLDEVDRYIQEYLGLPEIHNEKGEEPYSYRLVSIVNHMGLSTSTGHYLSDVYDMKKKAWYSYDDSYVTKMSQKDVMDKRERSGYIFFYMSKDIFDEVTLNNEVVLTDRKSNLR